MKGLKSLLFFMLLSLPFACQKSSNDPAPPDIFGFWRYQVGVAPAYWDNSTELFPTAYLLLNEDGSLSGFSSRNILNGDFTYDGAGSIQLNAFAVTRVADNPWSARFQEVLNEIDQYLLKEDTLVLTDSETGEDYIFVRLNNTTCTPVLVDEDRYQNGASDPFTIQTVKLFGTCLEITIGYGGGCEDVSAELVASINYAKAIPPQLPVRILFDDEDPCEAYIRRNFYFDISELQLEGYEELILNIDGWKDPFPVNF